LDDAKGKTFLKVLLNLIMHDYQPLVSRALSLLFRHFNQRKETLQHLNQVQLLVSETDIKNYKQIKRDLDQLRLFVEKSELWVYKKGKDGILTTAGGSEINPDQDDRKDDEFEIKVILKIRNFIFFQFFYSRNSLLHLALPIQKWILTVQILAKNLHIDIHPYSRLVYHHINSSICIITNYGRRYICLFINP